MYCKFRLPFVLTLFLVVNMMLSPQAQADPSDTAFQGFEGNNPSNEWAYTVNPATYNNEATGDVQEVNGDQDVWAIIKEFTGDIDTPSEGTFFWGMQDLDNSNGGGSSDHTLAFATVDTSTLTDVQVTFDHFSIGFDSTDTLRYQLFFDTVGQGEVALAKDTGGAWLTTSVNVPDTVNQVSLILYAFQNGGTDYAGWDNVRLFEASADTTEPLTSSFTPVDDATNVAVDTNLLLQLNENVQFGTTGNITLKKTSDDSVIETFDVSTSSQLSVSGDTITIDPTSDLDNATEYYVIIDNGAIEDLAGNPYQGFSGVTVWSFTTIAAASGGWVINEVNADPDATNGDANGDGTVNTTQDEFVEIVNNTGGAVDISGWTLSDGVGVRHTFPATTVIADQCAVLVFAGGTPTGAFGGATVQAASEGQLGLNNTGDTVTLNDGIIDQATATYTGAGGNDQSLTLDPDITGASFVQHTSATGASGSLFSPGTQIDGTPFSGCTVSVEPALTLDKVASPTTNVLAGDVVTYTLTLENVGTGDEPTALLTDTLPTEVDFAYWIDQPAGATETSDEITWNGSILASNQLIVRFAVTNLASSGDVVNTAEFEGTTTSGTDDATYTASDGASSGGLVITEIMYNPQSGEPAWEWIEIYNNSAAPIDLANYFFDDNSGTALTAANVGTSGGPYNIPVQGTAVLYHDNLTITDFEAAWGNVPLLIPVTNWPSLNNGGDQIGLWESLVSYDSRNFANAIETVTYAASGAWPTDDGDASIYLTNLNADNTDGNNWALSANGATTPLFDAYISLAQGSNSGSDIGSPGTAPTVPAQPLLLTEIVVTPTAGEFIEIYNPNSSTVDLSDIYLTDATYDGSAGGSAAYYYNIVIGLNAGGGSFGDFHARFPAGASIGGGEYQTIAIAGSDDFLTEYGVDPTYELYEDGGSTDSIPDMREAIAGSINNQGGLTNGGEVVILYTWDGLSDLVTDLDYAVWGDKAEAVDKASVSIDGPDADSDTSSYQNDTSIASQAVIDTSNHSNDKSWQREDFSEGAETKTGGNGAEGHDETSEDLDNTICEGDPTPNAATVCGVTDIFVTVQPSTLNGWSFFEEVATGNGDFVVGPATAPLGRGSAEFSIDATGRLLLGTVDYAGLRLDEIVSLSYDTYRSAPDGSVFAPTLQFNIDYDLTDSDTTTWQGRLVFEPYLTSGNTVLDDTWQTWDPLAGEWWSSGAPGNTVCPQGNPCTWNEVLTNFPNAGIWPNDNPFDTSTPLGTTQFKAGGPWSPDFVGNVDNFMIRVDDIRTTYDFEPDPQMVKIHEVQGSGSSVTNSGIIVTVEGVVIGDYQGSDELDGFFIQEETTDEDSNPATSEGIFVYCGNDCGSFPVSEGQIVEVTGLQEEFQDMSQLDVTGAGTSVTVTNAGNNLGLVTAASVDLPAPAGTDQEATFESVEGMLVTFVDKLTVTEFFQMGRFGQIVLSEGGKLRQFTDQNVPDATGYAAYLEDIAKRRIILDDTSNIENGSANVYHPQPGGFAVDNFIRGGYTVDSLTGVMHWSWAGDSGTDAWRIRPQITDHVSFNADNPRQATPTDVGGDIKVATLNVLNYFTTIDEGSNTCGPNNLGCRGAHSQAELVRQTQKLTSALLAIDADIFAVVEIENNETASLQAIVDALNSATGGTNYAYVNTGFIGGDAIKVGYIYKPALVGTSGNAAVLDTPAFVEPNTPGDPKNRPALAQTFEVVDSNNNSFGEKFTAVVNHLKSKGSSCGAGDDDITMGQGNCNDTRTKAAQALMDWLATDPTSSGDPDFMILGDLNAYAMEDPIKAVEVGADDTANTSDDFVNLIKQFNGSNAYSFVFDGQWGYLDHALANASLTAQVTGLTEWHINSDEVNLLDYNDKVLDAAEESFEAKPGTNTLFAPDLYRVSDHDPVIIGLSLYTPQPQVSITKETSTPNLTLGETAEFTITVENTGDFALTNVAVVDDLAPDCANPAIGELAVDAEVSYTCSMANVQTTFTNVATATADSEAGSVQDVDSTTITLDEVKLGLTAECRVGDTLYWRVTGDDITNGVDFNWNHLPSSDNGSGQVNATGRQYFTTTWVEGDSNTVVMKWIDPKTSSEKQKPQAHNNQPCVYHVSFEKMWTGADAPDLDGVTLLTAESSVATATCTSDDGALTCTYTRTSDNGSLNDLHVPFGETYDVTENSPIGWIVTSGAGTGYTGIDGFDDSQIPNDLVYDVNENRYCESNPDAEFPLNLEKFCTHTVENESEAPGIITIVKTANPADTGEQFSFTGNLGGFSLQASDVQSFTVFAGSYDVTEIEIPAFWTLLTVQCGDQFLPITDSVDPLGRQVTIKVEAGEELTCTFHNERVNYEAPVEDDNKGNKIYLPFIVK